jgi:hypothetical protein
MADEDEDGAVSSLTLADYSHVNFTISRLFCHFKHTVRPDALGRGAPYASEAAQNRPRWRSVSGGYGRLSLQLHCLLHPHPSWRLG